MAKKRDQHRQASTSGRRENRVNSSSRQPEQTNSNLASGGIKIAAFFIISSVIAIVSYKLSQSSPSQHNEPYVYQRGLIKTDANYQDILTVSTFRTTLSMSFYLLENSTFDSCF